MLYNSFAKVLHLSFYFLGKEDEVFKKLKLFALNNTHFQVYKRSEIPVNFHYKKCSRAPPIMVLAEPKYAFQDLYEGIKWYKTHYNDG